MKPNFKLLGSKLGKAMKAAHEKLSQLSQQEIQSLEKSGSISLNLEGNVVEISLTEVEVISEDVAGWQVASEGGVTVALDTTVTESLREEGNAREIVNQIQKLRKELDFNVTDRILVLIERKPELISSVQNFKEYICAEILADTFELTDNVIDGNSWKSTTPLSRSLSNAKKIRHG